MKATKGNKVYTIDETQKAMYQAQGYDITDDAGNIIEYGAGKSVSYEEYKTLEERALKLEKENKKLKEENKELKKKIEELESRALINPRKVTDEQVKKIKELRASGLSYRAIVKEIGLSTCTIQRALKGIYD